MWNPAIRFWPSGLRRYVQSWTGPLPAGPSESNSGPNGTPYLSDYAPDTPYLGERYCPQCEPNRDPTREILEPVPCSEHAAMPGTADDIVIASHYLSGSAESGGDENRRWCDIVHRGIVSTSREPE
jgi:hypothetical protein